MHLRWTVGDVTITRILESVSPVPPEGLFAEASADARLGAQLFRTVFDIDRIIGRGAG